MGQARTRAVVLDAGALVAFERYDRRVVRLVERAVETGGRLHTPAGVLAQVWRDGARQVRLTRLLGSGVLEIRALDLREAQAAGSLCGRSSTADVVDASVALLARRLDATVVTSDAGDLRRLDASLELFDV